MAEDPTQLESKHSITVPAGQEENSPQITVTSEVCGPAPYVSVMMEKYCAGQTLESRGGRVLARTEPYDYYAAGYFNQATAGKLDLQPVVDRIATQLDPRNPSGRRTIVLGDDEDETEMEATALNDLVGGLGDEIKEGLRKTKITLTSGVDPATGDQSLKFRADYDGDTLFDVDAQDIRSFDPDASPGAPTATGLETGSGAGGEVIEENGPRSLGFNAHFRATSSGEAGEQANDTNNVNALVNGGFLIISVAQANLATALQANFGFNLANNNGNSGNP